MVGFGSSLRMGRRSGWDAAYLDYETLKLLLSQIESVYEEEYHQKQSARDVYFGDESKELRRSKHGKTQSNYRDELFLESDSDAAFASSQSTEEDSTGGLGAVQDMDQLPDNRNLATVQPFTIMGSSFSEDSEASSGNCVGMPWRHAEKKDDSKKKRKKKSKKRYSLETFGAQATANPKSFILNEPNEVYDPALGTLHTPSLLNAQFQYHPGGTTSENTSLLPQPTTFRDESIFRGVTNDESGIPGEYSTMDSIPSTLYGSTIAGGHSPSGAGMAKASSEWEKERRRQRRRRRLAKKRRQRRKGVPRHIRIAHSKSRSITERFLGLLRAEVEKVTLFAHARLGELADTAGSLRFLSSEELTELSHAFTTRASSSAYEHPLSDGGIHPSASSSSDEGAVRQGLFPWSDSSSDEERSRTSSQYAMPSKFSTTRAEPQQDSGILEKTDPRKRVRSKQEQEQYERAKRKIDKFQELRMESPIFQRNDRIVGDDLLLVSAVDEADAYSAVGVELLHILKYICVNLIAVRKICRKHDYLLQNRMLGGYYHRKRTFQGQEAHTLGGLIAHVAGDLNDAHPALIGLVNHGKLVGVYDHKVQQLANSRTVKVVCSCLALALSEYEVSRTRADALATLNAVNNPVAAPVPPQKTDLTSQFASFSASKWVSATSEKLSPFKVAGEDDEAIASDEENPPSTASSVSLARLRFTVLSIAALREASRQKLDLFATYLSRSSLSFTGHAVVGDGLDGCSRETLDFLVAYTPDAALLLDSSLLHEGLVHGKWRNLSIANAMRASLAVALRGRRSFEEEEQAVTNALSILPKSEGIDMLAPARTKLQQIITWLSISRFVDISPGLLRSNRMSLFLYTANYYMAHPMTNAFTAASGANVAYTAAIIGISNISAILAAVLHCNVLSPQTSMKNIIPSFQPYRLLLILSSIFAIAGNVVQARGTIAMSVPVSVLGRLLIGFASAGIVHRQFLTSFFPPSLLVSESARLVQIQVLGLIFGLLLGSLLELAPFRYLPYGIESLEIGNWIMVALWCIQFCGLLCGISSKESRGNSMQQERPDAPNTTGKSLDRNDYDSDSSGSGQGPEGPARLFHQPLALRQQEVQEGAAKKNKRHVTRESGDHHPGSRSVRKGKVVSLMKRLRGIMAYNVAVPLTLALTAYTVFAQEVLFSSCALIAHRYFLWRGNVAGFFLMSLSVVVVPLAFICEQIARRYEERTTIKRALLLLGLGLLVMTNWGSVFAMVVNLKILFTETKDMRHHYYDWLLGIPQYVIGFMLTFVGLKSLQSASASLLSKVSPPHLRYVMTNLGTIITFVGHFAQLLADLQILAVGLSHRVINTDIVNALVMPLLIACVVAHFFVRKHFFFLM